MDAKERMIVIKLLEYQRKLLILMIVVFGKMLIWATKAALGIIKILLWLVLLPIILIGLAYVGLIYVAIMIVLICGIVTWIVSAFA
jgi:hypothetical protein